MHKRLFVFGCSFTNWWHPTWADIVNWHIKPDIYENWGLPGLGNNGIFSRMLQCDIKNKFTDNDIILVLWSSWSREDRYINGTWMSYGNIFNNAFYDKKFIEKYWSISNDIIKNATSIISANRMFNIKFQGSIQNHATYDPGTNFSQFFTPEEIKLLDFYMQHIKNENVFHFNYKSSFVNSIRHPDVMQHYTYASRHIFSKLNIIPNIELTKKCLYIQRDIILNKDKHNDYWPEFIEKNYNLTYDRSVKGF